MCLVQAEVSTTQSPVNAVYLRRRIGSGGPSALVLQRDLGKSARPTDFGCASQSRILYLTLSLKGRSEKFVHAAALLKQSLLTLLDHRLAFPSSS